MANTFTDVVLTTLGKVAGTSAEGRLDGSIGSNPVGKGVFAVLDDTVFAPNQQGAHDEDMCEKLVSNLRLASLIAVISFTGLSWSYWGIIDKFQEVLAKASNDGKLLAVLLKSVELISESCLELLTGDVGKLSFCYERLCLSTDKFLLENDNARAIRLLVLELSNLIGDLLLAYRARSLVRSLSVERRGFLRSLLG